MIYRCVHVFTQNIMQLDLFGSRWDYIKYYDSTHKHNPSNAMCINMHIGCQLQAPSPCRSLGRTRINYNNALYDYDYK